MDGSTNWSMTANDSTTMTTVHYSQLAEFARVFLKPAGVISVVAASTGIIFNILNIIVLTHPKMRNSVNLLLTLLAVSQVLLLLFYIPYVTIFNINLDIDSIPTFHTTNIQEARFLLFYTDISVLLQLSASWLIITTACFRFIYVQFPLKSSKLCSYQRAITAGCCTVLACLLISLPNMMLNTIIQPCIDYRESEWCRNNATYYSLGINYSYGEAFTIFNFWLYAVFGKFLPAILLLVFTVFLIRVLREANQRKKRLHSDAGGNRNHAQSNNSSNEHAQTARMLLAVVISFFCIEFPHGVLIAYMVVAQDFYMYDYLGEVIDLATVIAFSCNLILYSAMSRQYRKLFISIFIRMPATKLRFDKFSAKYKKCSCSGISHNAVCLPVKAETCALSVAHDTHTMHSVLPSDESLNLIDSKQKFYVEK
ncbi:G-protein coupled receptor dmsr-1-like [Watersipora subatra]|uniref:G-protein coupled receptor dmsr-1-like n=1 Tax=Watersipora subatra TaxID=2589382 RepID=UPI00355C5290